MSTLSEVKSQCDQIFSCLEEIKLVAVNILKKLDPVMKGIKDPKNDIVTQGLKKYPEHPIDTLQNAMQSVTIEWIKDASAIKLEIDTFVQITDEGIRFQTSHPSETPHPFLTEVWTGDAYDLQGLDGLKALKKDLDKQFIDINRENLFLLASKHIKEGL